MRREGKKRSAPLLQDFNRYPNPLWEQPGLRRRPCFEPPRRPIHGGTFNRNPRKSPGSQPLFYLINRVFFLDRPGAVKGAERRSGPLTARTDLESCAVR